MSMMSFLDNGQIRLGVDLARGGAVTFLADCRDIGDEPIQNARPATRDTRRQDHAGRESQVASPTNQEAQ